MNNRPVGARFTAFGGTGCVEARWRGCGVWGLWVIVVCKVFVDCPSGRNEFISTVYFIFCVRFGGFDGRKICERELHGLVSSNKSSAVE